ncbi:hypothetical protein ABOM_011144 [Aspergillus bombycis]|uniref:Fatty acid hydroxylase domain-containing protein n=1 Tax=Aspergillus bombycis TaxID=109264 RepID=A0A1F7ZP01_9EURO|nr:hypothetical protein ABOM_011144 [Aspergillus bombycis]OGM40785.1 hypothetical protein ABOM_011144 [Aspergillus bombycis]
MRLQSRSQIDSMKSSWRSWDRRRWNAGHWLIEILAVHPISFDKRLPVHPKTAKVPYASQWRFNVWVLIHAIIPLVIHETFSLYFSHQFSPLVAGIFYSLSLQAIGVHELHMLRQVGHTHGYFDGDTHDRDGVPDTGVWRTVWSLLSGATLRPLMLVTLAYQVDQGPLSIRWGWLLLETGLYAIVLDFWFYWYHRLMHESHYLWKFHRTHHLIKHPIPLLSAYADLEQEFFDVVGIPLMTYGSLKLLCLPMGFYEWWICQQYIIFTEALGHSGLRIKAIAANPWSWLFSMMGVELVIEDHDLHHRRGWRKSHNYGKQTRIWDKLFGTTYPRVEGYEGNIDYDNPAKIPLL